MAESGRNQGHRPLARRTWAPRPNPDYPIEGQPCSREWDLWVGTDNGIVRWNGKQLVAVGPASSINSNSPWA